MSDLPDGPRERAAEKARRHAAGGAVSATVDGMDIVTSVPYVDGHGALVVDVVTIDGKRAAGLPWRYVNPPLTVDGRYDPQAALKAMLLDTVRQVG